MPSWAEKNRAGPTTLLPRRNPTQRYAYASILCYRSKRLRLYAGLFLPRLGPRGRSRRNCLAPRPRFPDAIRSRLACHQSQTRRSDVNSILRFLRRVVTRYPRQPKLGVIVAQKVLIAFFFLAPTRFPPAAPKKTIPAYHAPLPLLPADPARDPEGSGGRLPPADAARGPHPPRGRRDLRVAAARLSRAQKDRADRARGAGPRGCHRALDAHVAACRSLARERTLRRLRPGNVARQGSP